MVANVALGVGLIVLFGVAAFIFVIRTSKPQNPSDRS